MPEWLQSPVAIFGLAIGAMFFGYFFGLFEGRGQGYKRRKAEEADEKKSEVADPVESNVETPPPAGPPPASDETSVLDVSMDSAGQLRLKLDGQRIEATNMDADQRKRMITVLTQIRPWLDSSKQAAPPTPPQPASSSQGDRQEKPSPQAASSSQGIPAPTPRPALKPAPTPPPTATPRSGDDKNEPVSAPQSIVGQIDSILQAQMVGTPLIEKGIRLQESPEGGVIVWVGIDKFETVDDVPDEQIKAAIRAAISVWESKYTPGL